MIYQLLAHQNNFTYNLKIANIFGVYSAVYIALLLNNQFDVNKNENSKNYFILSRQQIYDSTGLEDSRQLEVEQNLIECKLIEIKPVRNNSEKFYFYLDINLLTKFLNADTAEEAQKILVKSGQKKKLIKAERTPAPSKRSIYQASLKRSIVEEDTMIREYLCEWIDAVYGDPKGYLSVSAIKETIKTLKEYTNNDVKVIVEILKVAVKTGWRNIDWVIIEWKKTNPTYIDKRTTDIVKQKEVKISDIAF